MTREHDSDRTVHAARAGGPEVVRYDIAGKWYLEWPTGSMIPAQRVSLRRAVHEALMADHEQGGYVALGRPGGLAFDAAFRKAKATA